MPSAPVRRVPYPRESQLHRLYKSAYFIDSFAVTLPPKTGSDPYQPAALARAAFCQPPAWFSVLMWIRDRVMSVFGVKPSTVIQADAERRGIETIWMFPVLARSEREIVMGEVDSHLDFQASILIRDLPPSETSGQDGVGQELVATTVVHCHGLLGKAYITVIRGFHVLIVKYNLARVPQRLADKRD